MKRTISLKLTLTQEQSNALLETQKMFSEACNRIVPYVIENRCWNQYNLHQYSYYPLREELPSLGAQMVCCAIKKVCCSFKVLKIKKSQEVPTITFNQKGSVHYDKRTFSLKDVVLSLFTVCKRIRCSFQIGLHQEQYLSTGKVKEGELIRKGKRWFFNLVLDIPNVESVTCGTVFAIDVGENNLATTSNGRIYGGGQLKHKRDRFLARRKKLQSNGSHSAKRCLKRISGKERRHVREINHIISKEIVEEAAASHAKVIVLENLTNIRKRIKGNKRMRSRLHRWSWRELQQFVKYKAEGLGISTLYVNPAYSSQICSKCGCMGSRYKHTFTCLNCGSFQHSDRNAAINLLKLGKSKVLPTAPVNGPMVAMA